MDRNPYQPPQDETHTFAPSESAQLKRAITLHGSMPIRDVLHTQMLILSKRWIYALICLALYAGFVIALSVLNPTGWMFGRTFVVLGLIVMPAILPFTLFMVYIRLVRDSRRQIGIFAKTETILSPDGIRARVNDDDASIPWSTFNSFLCSQRVVLLFLKDTGNHLIISRAKLANAEDWSILLQFLHERFPKR